MNDILSVSRIPYRSERPGCWGPTVPVDFSISGCSTLHPSDVVVVCSSVHWKVGSLGSSSYSVFLPFGGLDFLVDVAGIGSS